MTFGKLFDSANKTDFGIKATDVIGDILEYKVPERIRDEIPTLNQYGYMKEELDEFSQEFLTYAASSSDIVLELGTAYGWLVSRALERGIKIIANDISEEHLAVLLKNNLENHLENLYLYLGKFPEEVNFPKESLAAVMSARMFHFLDGNDVEKGLSKVHNWLKADGKFFFSNCSIYHYSVKDQLIQYKERAAAGDLWPGQVTNQRERAPMHAPYVQDLFNAFDIPQLEQLLPKFGFEIERIKLFDYPKDTYSEGIGHVGLVARKI
ncbi:MAG: class I SAM-dependent methyltransferase [Rickettsiaceae bacterium]|nr:MAG: class I SAM-dependent methyltransferase [Rickettsiaceae bacterium]